jgi:hypothetical protein
MNEKLFCRRHTFLFFFANRQTQKKVKMEKWKNVSVKEIISQKRKLEDEIYLKVRESVVDRIEKEVEKNGFAFSYELPEQLLNHEKLKCMTIKVPATFYKEKYMMKEEEEELDFNDWDVEVSKVDNFPKEYQWLEGHPLIYSCMQRTITGEWKQKTYDSYTEAKGTVMFFYIIGKDNQSSSNTVSSRVTAGGSSNDSKSKLSSEDPL